MKPVPEEAFVASLASCHMLLHHEAHEACFIANSVKTAVECEPRYANGEPRYADIRE